jgi:FkbM family methyltransferase
MGAQNNIDRIILETIGNRGFFVEAGGSDPFDQNNTYLLESTGWKGMVVEPKLDFNKRYEEYRPNTIVENFALVSFDHQKESILADFSHYMMGAVDNIHGFTNWNPSEYPCSTLDFLLKKHNMDEVDFFSLDVEGYEVEVLKGIDFSQVFFHIMVIENHSSLNGVNLSKPSMSDFSFLEELGFDKKLVIGQHEFYINRNSRHNEKFR